MTPRLLGAVFAGGKSRRFGSDKAMALLDGKPLIAHVVDRLAPQCAMVAVVGRVHPGAVSIADPPGPSSGPIGALAAALAYAAAHGFDAVLTSGCDLPEVPTDLVARLGPGPAVAAGQPLLGVWPTVLADAVGRHVAAADDRSYRRLVARFAVEVDLGGFANINTPADLATAAADRDRPRG